MAGWVKLDLCRSSISKRVFFFHKRSTVIPDKIIKMAFTREIKQGGVNLRSPLFNFLVAQFLMPIFGSI